jgi:hypothetical protein
MQPYEPAINLPSPTLTLTTPFQTIANPLG